MFKKHLTHFGMTAYGWSYGKLGKGRMWRVNKNMYDITQGVVSLKREKPKLFNIRRPEVAQGCSTHVCHLFYFLNRLLVEVQTARIGIATKNDVKIGDVV